jgi:hypothetical protein
MHTHTLTLPRAGVAGIRGLFKRSTGGLPSAGAPRVRKDDGVGPARQPARQRGILERLDHWLWTLQQRNIERYLAQASDVFDLEARMNALERRTPHPYY